MTLLNEKNGGFKDFDSIKNRILWGCIVFVWVGFASWLSWLSIQSFSHINRFDTKEMISDKFFSLDQKYQSLWSDYKSDTKELINDKFFVFDRRYEVLWSEYKEVQKELREAHQKIDWLMNRLNLDKSEREKDRDYYYEDG